MYEVSIILSKYEMLSENKWFKRDPICVLNVWCHSEQEAQLSQWNAHVGGRRRLCARTKLPKDCLWHAFDDLYENMHVYEFFGVNADIAV